MTPPEANRASLCPFFFSDKMRNSKKRKTMEIGRMSELLPKRRRLDEVQKKSVFSASRPELSSTPPRRASPEPLSAHLLTAPASLSPSDQMKYPKKRKMANRHDEVQQQPKKKIRSPAVPEDLNFEIMERLPARSVGRFRCVSKTWLSIATSRSFIKAHAVRSRITRQMLVITDPGISPESHLMIKFYEANLHAGICLQELLQLKMMDEGNPLASCDGLILLRCIPTSLCSIPLSQFCIINPLTGSSRFLPQNTLCFSNFLGFYFHRPSSEYRILGSLDSGISYVNAVGESSWRRIQDRRPPLYQILKSVDVGKNLYWLAWKKSSDDDDAFPGKTPPTNVMAFDKEAEVYSLLPLPPSEELKDRGGNLMDFNGELGLWFIGGNGVIDFWIMRDCWIKRCSVYHPDLEKYPINFSYIHSDEWQFGSAISVKDEELLIGAFRPLEQQFLIHWNLKTGVCSVQNAEDYSPNLFIQFPHVEALTFI